MIRSHFRILLFQYILEVEDLNARTFRFVAVWVMSAHIIQCIYYPSGNSLPNI